MGSDDFGMGYRAGEVVAFWDYFRPYALTLGVTPPRGRFTAPRALVLPCSSPSPHFAAAGVWWAGERA